VTEICHKHGCQLAFDCWFLKQQQAQKDRTTAKFTWSGGAPVTQDDYDGNRLLGDVAYRATSEL